MTKLFDTATSYNNRFDELFNSYYDKVVCFIARIVKSEEVAEDLTQDLFVKLWESRERIDITLSMNAYIYTAAKNRALNYLSKKREERMKFSIEELNTLLEFDAHELYATQEIYDTVRKVVMAMPEPRREVFILSRSKGLKNDEIANQLGIKPKTVEFHMTKALSEIRRAVK